MTEIDPLTLALKINELIEELKLDITPVCLHDEGLDYPSYGGGGIYCKKCKEMVDHEEVYDD